MRSNQKPVIIFSAERAQFTGIVNQIRHHALEAHLQARGIPYVEVLGCYQGSREKAVIVDAKHEDFVKLQAFKVFDQESIVYLDNEREAYLVGDDGTSHHIGRLRAITKEQADQADSWAYSPVTKQFYGVFTDE